MECGEGCCTVLTVNCAWVPVQIEAEEGGVFAVGRPLSEPALLQVEPPTQLFDATEGVRFEFEIQEGEAVAFTVDSAQIARDYAIAILISANQHVLLTTLIYWGMSRAKENCRLRVQGGLKILAVE